LRETSVSVQPVAAMSGATKTLHPYAAPRQICITTAATAIHHRLRGIDFDEILAAALECKCPSKE
jgi:hypothetical protein